MRDKKGLLPSDFRDFLSIFSFVGFLGVSLYFLLGVNWISNNMNAILLLIGGSAFLVIGKVVTAKRWIRDGIQQNELSQLLAIIVGISSIVIGLLFLFGFAIPTKYYGYIGIIALVPALYTLVDYISKNRG